MKRFLTLLMTVVMAVSMLSAFAFAADCTVHLYQQDYFQENLYTCKNCNKTIRWSDCYTLGCTPSDDNPCECARCGHIRHNYEVTSFNTNYHVYECACGKRVTQAHVIVLTEDGMKCRDCDFVYNTNCGDNASWKLDQATGTLTITGTGDVTDRSGWTALKTQVKKIVVEEGITSLPYCAFYAFKAEAIELPASLTSIGASAFALCDSLESASFAGTQEQWSAVAVAARNDLLTAVISYK